MVLLIGMIPVSAAVALYAYAYIESDVSTFLSIGGLLYFFGVYVVSMGGNIPMNKRLEAMPQGGVTAQAYWPSYLKGWVLWNRIRWVAALRTSVCYMIGAVLMAQSL